MVYKVVDARGVRILLREHVKNLQEGLNESFAQPSFLVNSGHCEEQSDVAILWLINVL